MVSGFVSCFLNCFWPDCWMRLGSFRKLTDGSDLKFSILHAFL